ncbi:MAG: hypothetical protein ABSH21_01300 [Verrucomicrobiia bacterium]|jgi:hypothetical protein
MDIEFYCFKCGQHIVIDEAGAGQAVNCPKCGQPLAVPQTQPGPSKPMTPAHIPPVISKPVTQKRKRPTGLIVGLGVTALLILLAVMGNFSSQPASAPSVDDKGQSDPCEEIAFNAGFNMGHHSSVKPSDGVLNQAAANSGCNPGNYRMWFDEGWRMAQNH